MNGGNAIVSGGALDRIFYANDGSHVEFQGSQFSMDGQSIAGLANPGDSLVLDERGGAILTGIFADGSPFEFDLNSSRVLDEDLFSADSVLQLTLVPEPTSLGLVMLAAMFVVLRPLALDDAT